MNLNLLASSICLIIFSTFVKADDLSCAKKIQYNEAHISTNSEDEAIKKISSADYQVWLFGENHEDLSSRQYRETLFKKIQKESLVKIDCLLLELPNDLQRGFDRISRGEETFEDFIKSMRPTIPDVSEDNVLILQQSMRELLSPLFVFAKDRNVRIFSIDDDQKNLESKDGGIYLIGERNQLFRNKIESLFSQKLCSKAIFVVGTAHIGTYSKDETYRSLNQQMSKLGLKTIATHSSSFTNTIMNPLTEFTKCNQEQSFPKENFVLEIKKDIEKSPLLIPMTKDEENDLFGLHEWMQSQYSDFDFLFFNF